MNLAQDNFDRARVSGQTTLRNLAGGGDIDLSKQSTPRLQTMAWDLESIQAAIRLELMNREADKPMDFG